MKRIILILSLMVLFSSMTACTKFNESSDNTKQQQNTDQKHQGETQSTPGKPAKKSISETLKKNKLNGYPQKSIGEAFEAYSKVASKEWQEAVSRDGKLYVDYVCWLESKAFLSAAKQNGVVRTGLDVKFVVQESGDAYITMASKLMVMNDGTVRSEVLPLPEVARMVDAIYNNRELGL